MLNRLYDWYYKKPAITQAPKKLIVDDESAPANSAASKDSLANFMDLLAAQKTTINSLLKEWMDHKHDVIGNDVPHTDHKHTMPCPIKTEAKVKSSVALFFQKLKGLFQSAKDNLNDQLKKEVIGHIWPLKQHINELCEMVNDKSKSEDERRDTIIHICNASILMLRELEGLTNNFADEIKYSVNFEAKEEAAAKLAINAALFMLEGLVGMILPPVDFDLRKEYRNFLSDEIQDPEASYECAITDAEGTLQMADGLVEKYALTRRGSGGIFSNRPLAATDDTAIQPGIIPAASSNTL